MSQRVCLFVLLLLTISSEILCNRRSLMPQAIGGVIEEYFVKNSVNYDVIRCSNQSGYESDVMEMVTREKREVSSTEIKSGNVNRITQSAIIICDSTLSLSNFNEKIMLTNKSPKLLNFLVVVENATAEDFAKMSSNTSGISRYQSFLIETKENFKLKAFSWFTKHQCGEQQMVEVNRFSKKTLTWKFSTFFSTEIRDFHGCKLSIGVLYPAQPASDVDFDVNDPTNSSFKVWGYNVEIVEALKSHLNFDISFRSVKVEDIKTASVIYDYVMLTYSLNSFLNKPYYTTSTFVLKEWLILVPPGDTYTGFEKLFLPFSFETWICFIIVTLIALIVICIVKLLPRPIQNFVFGRNVKTPILNLMIAFFGGGQMVLPGRNFARFLLTMYIIFSLIIRTAYQGILFELLQSEPRKKEVQSVEEMIEKNFTLYYKGGGAFEMIKEMDLFPRFVSPFLHFKYIK